MRRMCEGVKVTGASLLAGFAVFNTVRDSDKLLEQCDGIHL